MKKSFLSLFFFFLILNTLLISIAFAQNELVSNSSFEEIYDAKPVSWKTWLYNQSPGAVEFKTENGSARTGDNYAVIISNKENDARFMQDVMVEENSMYKISAWIKTENVGEQKLGANISIEGRLETSKDIRGTTSDWQYAEMYVATGKGIDRITISIGLGGYSNENKGKAFFDDVLMEKVDTIPQGAVIAHIDTENMESQDSFNEKTGPTPESPGNYTWILLVVTLALSSALLLSYYRNSNKRVQKDTELNNTEKEKN
jgi:hypothetical protein